MSRPMFSMQRISFNTISDSYIKKKSGGLEHGDECLKRISHSQVSDLVLNSCP